MDEKEVSPVRASNWATWAITAVVVLLLCGGFSAMSFAMGRASAEPETVMEFLEVTREVEVPMAIEVTVIATAVPEEETEVVAPKLETAVATDTPASAPVTRPEDIDFAIFNEAWNLVAAEFDGELPEEKEVLYAVIDGSLKTLDDDFTRFTNPEIVEAIRENKEPVEGIGAMVNENDDGWIEIVRPLSGQPAEAAGLLAGDLIIRVDGEDVAGMSMEEVLPLVRGPRGSEVVLTIFRPKDAEELEFTIIRARFEVPLVESKMVTDDIGYIYLSEFEIDSPERTQEALETLLSQGATRIIFDLRDNPGGYLAQSIDVADIFLPEGVVLLERNNKGLDRDFVVDSGDDGEQMPLVVLVNSGSASASEIVAGAVRDNERGTLIGETTFGKGSVQRLYTLSDGSELRVTVARWYTPSNVSISEQGITPDIEIPSPDAFTFGGNGDIQLERAIEYLQTGQ